MAINKDVRTGLRPTSLVAIVRRHEAMVLTSLIILNLLPIWAVPYFPSLDGPAHVSLTHWLIHYNDPTLPILHEFFEPNLQIFPNYLIFLVLYPLMLVFPAVIAEKILISIYAICLPLALRYALRGASLSAGTFAVFGCAFTFHSLLLLGFYNTSFAIAVFLLAIGCWLRWRHRLGLKVLAGYFGLSVLAYITHLSAVAATCLAIFFATVGLVYRDLFASGRMATWKRLLSHGLWPALGFAPVIVLCLVFMRQGGGGEISADGLAGFGVPDLGRVLALIRLEALAGHDGRELGLTLGLSATLCVLAWMAVRQTQERFYPGLFMFAGFLVLYLTAPFQFDVRWMPTRLMPYVAFAAMLWIAGMMGSLPAARQERLRALAIFVAIAMVLVGTGLRTVRWSEISELTAEYMSGNHLIEPNSTLLALRLSREIDGARPSDSGIGLFVQMGGYIAVERDIVDLRHFQAKTGRFPIIFRDEVNPYRHMATDAVFVGAPETISPRLYSERTGQQVDYVLLWGNEGALSPDSALAVDLAAHYELIHTSSPRAVMRLFRLAD